MSAHGPMPRSAWIFPALAVLLFAGVTASGFTFTPSAAGLVFAAVLPCCISSSENFYFRFRQSGARPRKPPAFRKLKNMC